MTTTANERLLKGAESGDLAGISSALQEGANVNAKDQYNNTALNSAAMFGHGEVVKALLEAGADIENKGSGGGMTPLANAASRGHFAIAQMLLDHGARVTNDLLSILQTKVNIFQENYEGGMVTQEGLDHWKQVMQFFITQRLKQDLPEIAENLSSASTEERRRAAEGVAEAASRGLDVAAAAARLPSMLSDADADTRFNAGRALTFHLAKMGEWVEVRKLLSSEDVRLRVAAVDALGGAASADASLIDPLGALLQDGDADVRTAAAFAVATLPGKGIDATSLLPRMLALLSDPDGEVRRKAAFAFYLWGRRGLRDYCTPALEKLRSLAENDDNDAVRAMANRAIAASE